MSATTLRFDGDRTVDLRQYAVSATAGQQRPSGLSLRASLGAIVAGTVTDGDRAHHLQPGVVAGIGAARQWTFAPWFVTGTLGLAASRVTTRERDRPGAPTVSLIATDLRAGVMAGRTFGAVSPYLLARAFGGPVFWTADDDRTTGTDTTHVQLGAGVSVTLASRLSVLLDVSALGERSASLGLSLRQ